MPLRLALPAIAVAAGAPPAAFAVVAALGHVRQQRHLARPLHRYGHLALMPAARAADAPRADLPLLGDVAAELADVLVVDLVDLRLAEEAGLAPAPREGRQALPAPSVVALSSQSDPSCQNGMSSSVGELPKSASEPEVTPAGTNRFPPPPLPWSPPPGAPS